METGPVRLPPSRRAEPSRTGSSRSLSRGASSLGRAPEGLKTAGHKWPKLLHRSQNKQSSLSSHVRHRRTCGALARTCTQVPVSPSEPQSLSFRPEHRHGCCFLVEKRSIPAFTRFSTICQTEHFPKLSLNTCPTSQKGCRQSPSRSIWFQSPQ